MLFIGLLSVLFLFQNCSQISHGGNGSQNTTTLSTTSQVNNQGGTGNGYDGKTYDVVNPTLVCNDGTHVISEIQFSPSGDGLLVRDNCTLLAQPLKLDPLSFSYNPAADIVTYNGTNYSNSNAPPPSSSPNNEFRVIRCDSSPTSYPVYHLLLGQMNDGTYKGDLTIEPNNTSSIHTPMLTLQLTSPSGSGLPATYKLSVGTQGQMGSLFVYLTQKTDKSFSAELNFNQQMNDSSVWAIDTGPGIPCGVTLP